MKLWRALHKNEYRGFLPLTVLCDDAILVPKIGNLMVLFNDYLEIWACDWSGRTLGSLIYRGPALIRMHKVMRHLKGLQLFDYQPFLLSIVVMFHWISPALIIQIQATVGLDVKDGHQDSRSSAVRVAFTCSKFSRCSVRYLPRVSPSSHYL